MPSPEQASLREENARLTAENTELRRAITLARRDADAKDSMIASRKAELASLKAEHADEMARIKADLAAEVEGLAALVASRDARIEELEGGPLDGAAAGMRGMPPPLPSGTAARRGAGIRPQGAQRRHAGWAGGGEPGDRGPPARDLNGHEGHAMRMEKEYKVWTGPLKDIPDGPIPNFPSPGQRRTGMSLRERIEGDGSRKRTKEEIDAAIKEWTKLPELEKNIQLREYSEERDREERLSRIP